MADVAFEGEFWIHTTTTPYTGGTDLSNNLVAIRGVPERLKIAIQATLGVDHAHEILGHSTAPFGFDLRGLTTAQKSTIGTWFEAKTWLRCHYQPLAGTAGTPTATNPDLSIDFQMPTHPMPPMNVTEDYIFSVDINAAWWQWDDGTTVNDFGTAQVS